jgi:hypothetical protein
MNQWLTRAFFIIAEMNLQPFLNWLGRYSIILEKICCRKNEMAEKRGQSRRRVM